MSESKQTIPVNGQALDSEQSSGPERTIETEQPQTPGATAPGGAPATGRPPEIGRAHV